MTRIIKAESIRCLSPDCKWEVRGCLVPDDEPDFGIVSGAFKNIFIHHAQLGGSLKVVILGLKLD